LVSILQKKHWQVGFLLDVHGFGREKLKKAGHEAETLIALAFALDVVAGVESSGF
jgi:hypothetical protein